MQDEAKSVEKGQVSNLPLLARRILDGLRELAEVIGKISFDELEKVLTLVAEFEDSLAVLGTVARQVLEDGEAPPSVKAKAVRALAVLEGVEALDVFLRLSRESKGEVLDTVMETLIEVAPGAVFEKLKADPDDEVRASAARALSMVGSEAAMEALAAAVWEDPAPEVRAVAVKGLGLAWTKRMHGAILKALNDPSALVREAAREALREDSS